MSMYYLREPTSVLRKHMEAMAYAAGCGSLLVISLLGGLTDFYGRALE